MTRTSVRWSSFVSGLAIAAVFAASSSFVVAAEKAPSAEGKIKPIKALLIVGGCCHDYDFQKRIIADGICGPGPCRLHRRSRRRHRDRRRRSSSTKTPNWADQFDVIVHDECFANVKEQEWMDRVLAPHKNGKPAVLLHCAMHCYRSGTDEWFKFCGIHSTGHGPQVPIALTNVDAKHPITAGQEDWTTIQEELYNNVRVFDTAHPLQKGKQHVVGQRRHRIGRRVRRHLDERIRRQQDQSLRHDARPQQLHLRRPALPGHGHPRPALVVRRARRRVLQERLRRRDAQVRVARQREASRSQTRQRQRPATDHGAGQEVTSVFL